MYTHHMVTSSRDRARPGRVLSTAAERTHAVLATAAEEFAERGVAGASTARVAERAGIAHSYVFKLFGTKVALFLAVTDVVYDAITERFRAASTAAGEVEPEAVLGALGSAYARMLGERTELLVLLQGFAASGDPDVGPHVRRRYLDLVEEVRTLSGASAERLHLFWAHGMLMTVAAGLGLPDLGPSDAWQRDLRALAADSPLG